MWGATTESKIGYYAVTISIHAPRVGRDSMTPQKAQQQIEISIHAPRVGRDFLRPIVLV